MQSSIEKKVMNQGPSLFDKKIQALAKLDTSQDVTAAVSKKVQSIPDIIQAKHSIDALECIDEIHESQNEKLQLGMPLLKDNLEYWAKYNYLPKKMNSIISLAIMDARNEQERKDNQLTEEDFFTNDDQIENLKKIKRRYNIEIDDEFFNSD